MPVAFVAPRTLLKGHPPSVTPTSLPNRSIQNEPELEDVLDLDEDVEMSGTGEFPGGNRIRNLVVPGQLVTDDPQFMR